MPKFSSLHTKHETQDIAVRQVMAWHRCAVYTNDGTGGVYLYKRLGSATYERHVTAKELAVVRSGFAKGLETEE